MRGIHRSPVNSRHKFQWRGALMFSLICAWINGWVNNDKAGETSSRPVWRHCNAQLNSISKNDPWQSYNYGKISIINMWRFIYPKCNRVIQHHISGLNKMLYYRITVSNQWYHGIKRRLPDIICSWYPVLRTAWSASNIFPQLLMNIDILKDFTARCARLFQARCNDFGGPFDVHLSRNYTYVRYTN